MSRKLFSLSLDVNLPDTGNWPRWLRYLVPHPGTLIFTLLVVAGLFWATSAGALPLGRSATLAPAATSTGTIAYQGRLADTNGSPLTGTYNMIFRLYDAASGGVPLWEEQWTGSNGVAVSDGLFNVMLGSLTAIPQSVITGNGTLWLGITVGTDDEMTPRVQLGSVPFAVQALTVPDGSVTTAKIADGAVTANKLAPEVAGETVYTLTLTGWVQTTSSTSASFGTIDLPMNSDLYVMSMWVLQNNSSSTGLSAKLKVDGATYNVYGGVVPFSSAGIGYTIARNHYIPNVSAGSHTFSVDIGQFPFRSGDTIAIGPESVMWIRAVPRR